MGLNDLGAWLDTILETWNVPGMGVGVVQGDELVFARGFGWRDYEKKTPFTPRTLFQIASNTKLFTAVAAGLMVEEGKLTWDAPVRDSVSAIRFHSDYLNNNLTLRDMLSHRTGITRHDLIWYKSEFTRAELFDRIRFLEPREPLRKTFLYNNMMYMAAGHLCELRTGQTWEDFVRQRIFEPLEMRDTIYSVAEMMKRDDYFAPYTEKRDSTEIHRIPYMEDVAGIAPAGAIISSIEDVSHWLITLMNQGRFRGRQILPPTVLAATMEPAMALPNVDGETRGFWEVLNAAYGLGRFVASYRGRLFTFHGGALAPAYSQVSFMPLERLGVIVFVIGNHCAPLADVVSYRVYEDHLGMDLTPWSERALEIVKKGKTAGTQARARAGGDRVAGKGPAHALQEYVGDYVHPAYGSLLVTMEGDGLHLGFHKIDLPLTHFHYDRFDTPDDEVYGKWSVCFHTNPQGEVDRAVMSLDEADATFTRRADAPDRATLERLAGTYRTPDGFPIPVVLALDGTLWLAVAGQPRDQLLSVGGLKFRIQRFSTLVFEFVTEGGEVTALKQTSPDGVYDLVRL